MGEPGVTFMNPVIISMTESVYAHVFVTCTCTVCYHDTVMMKCTAVFNGLWVNNNIAFH